MPRRSFFGARASPSGLLVLLAYIAAKLWRASVFKFPKIARFALIWLVLLPTASHSIEAATLAFKPAPAFLLVFTVLSRGLVDVAASYARGCAFLAALL